MYFASPQHIIKRAARLIVLAFCVLNGVKGYTQNQSKNSQQLFCVFAEKEIEYQEIAAISNVLKIYNKTAKALVLKIKAISPSGWRAVNSAEKQYTVEAHDTLYVPIRLLANSNRVKGGFKYNIMAAVTVVENGQVVTASFVAGKPKVVDMKMEIRPGNRLYFLNGKSFMPFKVEMINAGNERQEMLLTLNKIGNDVMITDSAGKFLQRKYLQIATKAYSDTLLPFGLALLSEVRNQKRIDTYGYVYDQTERSRQHTVFVKAIEPGPAPENDDKKTAAKARISKTVEFIKLNSSRKISDYNGDVLPITFMANLNQLFNQQPVMNITMNGRKVIDAKSYATYFTQNTFSYYKVTDNTYKHAFGQLGYFHEKGSVQFGTGVQLSMPQVRTLGTSGVGLTGNYYITKDHKLGASISNKSGTPLNIKNTTFNLAYSGTYKKIVGGMGLSVAHTNVKFRTEIISFGVSAPLGRGQTLSVRGSYEGYKTDSIRYSGMLASINYGIRYLNNNANSRVQFMYHKLPSIIAGTDSLKTKPMLNAGLFNMFKLKKDFTINTQHNYFDNPIYDTRDTTYQQNKLFSNMVFLSSTKRTKTVVIPAVYFNYSMYFQQSLIAQGLQFNISRSDIESNIRVGLTLKGGFNRLLSNPEYGTFFTSQINSFANYKTWNLNMRYFYGPQSQFDVLSTLSRNTKYSQVMFVSLGNQYQFKNRHFILENTFSYNYVYLNLRQTTSLFSQFYYFAQGGWRMNFNFTFNYNVSDNVKYTYNNSAAGNYQSETGGAKQKNLTVQFGIGIKKEFGVPIPKKLVKHKYTSARFKAFLDLNGNRQFDAEEAVLENIVIRLNDFEAQTDANGEASFVNIQMGLYQMQVLSLESLGAWFPVKADSIDISSNGINFVPFSRGVQISGNVEINREKFSAGMKGNIDVSRIKIFVIDSAGKTITTLTDRAGDFTFYLPYGRYIIRFDESVLGQDFELAENDVSLQLVSGMESYYHTFFVSERVRKVKTKKFGSDGQVIPDQGGGGGAKGTEGTRENERKR